MPETVSLQPGQLLHQAFFTLKNPQSADDRAALIDGLHTLAGIPQIRLLHIGSRAATEARDVVDTGWDVLELMVFDSVADQVIYQTHPLHLAFIARCADLWAGVRVCDAVIGG